MNELEKKRQRLEAELKDVERQIEEVKKKEATPSYLEMETATEIHDMMCPKGSPYWECQWFWEGPNGWHGHTHRKYLSKARKLLGYFGELGLEGVLTKQQLLGIVMRSMDIIKKM